jgi:hypothetical protein
MTNQTINNSQGSDQLSHGNMSVDRHMMSPDQRTIAGLRMEGTPVDPSKETIRVMREIVGFLKFSDVTYSFRDFLQPFL